MPKKNASASTAVRYIAILNLIPAEPDSMSTTQIIKKLNEDGDKFQVTTRSIQRDLIALSGTFPLVSKIIGRKQYWSVKKREAILQVPGMGQSTALALLMAREYLNPVMPDVALDFLTRYFVLAETVLSNTPLAAWPGKVKIINRGPQLIPPKIGPAVQQAVYQGLLESKQIQLTYRRRGETDTKSYPVNPLGIVSRDGLVYLVGSLWNYDDINQFALHRIVKAKMLDEPARKPPGFNLEKYVHEDKEFSYPRSRKKIKLRALFAHDTGFHLSECRLSEDQTVHELPNEKTLVTATVEETEALRWWLLGFGNSVEVRMPLSLRNSLKESLRRALAQYNR